MSLALIVYLINVIPSIGVLAFVVLLFVGVLTAIMCTCGFIESDWTPLQKFYKKAGVYVGIAAVVCVVIPSERTLYTMLAAYGVEKVATNEKTQEILGNGVDILNLQLQKYKDELLKEKSK